MPELRRRPSLSFRAALAPRALLAAGLALAPCGALPAQELTVEKIMARDWIGTFPEDPYWGDDGRAVYYTKARPGSDVKDLHRIDLASGRDQALSPAELAAADYPGEWSADRKVKAWVRDGDLWVREAGRKAPRQLTRTTEEEKKPRPLLDGRVSFRRGDQFLAVDLATGRVDTLADIRFGKDKDEIVPPKGFVEEQNRRLIGFLAGRAARKAEAREVDDARRAASSRPLRPFFFEEKKEIAAAALAPTGRRLLLAIRPKPETPAFDDEDTGGGKSETMPLFVTDSGYVETKAVRPKVGTGKPETPELWLLDLVAGTRRKLDLSPLPGLSDDPLAELRAQAKAAAPAGEKEEEAPPAAPVDGKPAPRALRFDQAIWNDDGSVAALQLFSFDNKDRWIATVSAGEAPGTTPLPVTPRFRQSDPAWINWRFNEFGWTRDGRALWYLSEETGFSHLYLQPLDGVRLALTQGPFEVDHPLPARDGKSFLVSANREQAGTYEVYRVNAQSGGLEALTAGGGTTYGVPSPDEKELLLTSSWTTKPPELYLQPAKAGATAKRLTKSTTNEYEAVAWQAPEIVRIPSAHFAGSLQARLYDRPASRAAAGAPAVLFVHGAGYLQNAHAGWAGYYREHMFHTLLVERGYVVLDVDYRASSGYGRDHRTAIYRQMGWPEVEDLADGVAWLVANKGVDPAKVGVYGGSYGGFLTFMSMFNRPELFAAGAALRPVTAWAHYNHGYTSPILNTPEVDPDSYRRSSPLEYAQGLSKPLLICHGMVDDNVTFQDSVLLVERLIELGKTDLFETAIYPVEPHGFKEAASWTDEYKRILKLFERTLR